MGRVTIVSLAVLLVHVVSSQDVNFGDEQAPVKAVVEGDALPKTDGLSEDVETRFISGFDLNTFAGQVAAASVGTVIGNVGTNVAGSYLNNCNRRGKRSASERMYVNELMHHIAKRQAIEEANEKSGDAGAEPEVATRLFCPQDFLTPGGSSNSGSSYCDRCYCNDWNCRRDCRKCGNLANQWSSSNTGNSYPQNSNSGNYYPQNSGAHNHPSHNTGHTSTYVNCNNCYCRNTSCKNKCSKCRNNYSNNYNNYNNYNNNNQGNSWSSWSNSGNYNSGGYRGRSGATSEETTPVPEIVVSTAASNTDEVVFA